MSDRIITRHDNAPPLAERLELDHAALVKRAEEAAKMVPAEVRAIASDEEAEAYTETAADIKRIVEEADGVFEAEKKPWLEGGRTVDNFFRFRAGLVNATKRLAKAIGDWQTAKRAAEMKRQAEEAAREREAAALFGGDEPEETPPEAVKEAVRITTSTGTRATGSVRWQHRLVDLAKVPREFLCLNEAAVKAARDGMKARGMKIEDAKNAIAGIEIFEAVTTSIRT